MREREREREREERRESERGESQREERYRERERESNGDDDIGSVDDDDDDDTNPLNPPPQCHCYALAVLLHYYFCFCFSALATMLRGYGIATLSIAILSPCLFRIIAIILPYSCHHARSGDRRVHSHSRLRGMVLPPPLPITTYYLPLPITTDLLPTTTYCDLPTITTTTITILPCPALGTRATLQGFASGKIGVVSTQRLPLLPRRAVSHGSAG